jgi:hypothetical protein
MPPDRPYDLGNAQASTEARAATEVSGAARPRKVQTAFDTRFAADRMPPMVADVPKTPAPVAAFAPPRADAGPSIMTGRGLY